MQKVVFFLLLAFTFVGCRTTRYVPTEKVVFRYLSKTDSVLFHDSVWIHDSVISATRGDTTYIDRWHNKFAYKNIYRLRIDSVIKKDSIPVPYPVEKELSRWQQFELKYSSWAFGFACAIIVCLLTIIYRRTKSEKYKHNSQ